MFRSQGCAPNWASHFLHRPTARAMYGRPKTPSSSRIPLLHNPYNWGIFSIWQSPMFTPISLGYISIAGCPKITPHFPYTTLYSPTIKGPLPHYEKVRFNSDTNAHTTLLSHCLAYSRLGLICTPEGFWVASPRPVTLVSLHRSLELLSMSRTEVIEQFWLLVACPNFLPQHL